MKRIAVLSLVLVFAIAGAAMADKKIDQGTGYVGVASNMALTNPNTFLMGSMNTIEGGYFVIDGLEVGGILSLMYSNDENAVTDGATTTTGDTLFGIGAQLKYFFDASSFLAPYLGLGLEYASYSNSVEVEPDTGDSTTDEYTSSGIIVTPKFGMAFFVTKNFALDPGLYISYVSLSNEMTPDQGDSLESSDANLDVGFTFGLNFFF
jgi:outer membrane protein W